MPKGVEVSTIRNAPGDRPATVCLSGILQRSNEQFMPVARELGDYVVGVHDAGRQQEMDGLVSETVRLLHENLRTSGRVNLVGASMGGMKVPFVVEAYRRKYPSDSLNGLRVVLVDAPTGIATMKQAPDWSAGLLTSGAAGALLSTSFGDWVVAKMSKPPKDDEITVPSHEVMRELAGRVMSTEEWKEWVKQTATVGLLGYSGSLWWSWMEWMIRVGRDGSLSRACATLGDIDTTYVACTHPGNGDVAQPAAANWWQQHVLGLKTVEVYGTHCGFLQHQPEFATAIGRILAR